MQIYLQEGQRACDSREDLHYCKALYTGVYITHKLPFWSQPDENANLFLNCEYQRATKRNGEVHTVLVRPLLAQSVFLSQKSWGERRKQTQNLGYGETTEISVPFILWKEDWQVTSLCNVSPFPGRKQTLGTYRLLGWAGKLHKKNQWLGTEAWQICLGNKALHLTLSKTTQCVSCFLSFQLADAFGE